MALSVSPSQGPVRFCPSCGHQFSTAEPTLPGRSGPENPPPPPPPPRDLGVTEGQTLGDRYQLVRLLGQGGMGQVWLARDTVLDGDQKAVKILPRELWQDEMARANLKQEARIAERLSHPNLVRLMTLQPGEPSFLVMEFVDGPTLAGVLARRKSQGLGPMTAAEVLPILEHVAAGLDEAHRKGLIHRDIKPSNILLETTPSGDWFAKLGDFGIAAELSSFQSRMTGVVAAGTPYYMSPEQQACQKLTIRTDIYSLGATVYEMLTLGPPFQGGNISWAIANSPVPIPEGVPGPVTRVVLRSMAKTPEERQASALDLVAEFRSAAALSSATPVPVPPGPSVKLREESHPPPSSPLPPTDPVSPRLPPDPGEVTAPSRVPGPLLDFPHSLSLAALALACLGVMIVPDLDDHGPFLVLFAVAATIAIYRSWSRSEPARSWKGGLRIALGLAGLAAGTGMTLADEGVLSFIGVAFLTALAIGPGRARLAVSAVAALGALAVYPSAYCSLYDVHSPVTVMQALMGTDTEAMFQVGLNSRRSMEGHLILSAAMDGHAEAQRYVAQNAGGGYDIPPDRLLAWLGDGVRDGSNECRTILGKMLVTGDRVLKDRARGIALLREALENGESWHRIEGRLDLADALLEGKPLEVMEAVSIYKEILAKEPGYSERIRSRLDRGETSLRGTSPKLSELMLK